MKKNTLKIIFYIFGVGIIVFGLTAVAGCSSSSSDSGLASTCSVNCSDPFGGMDIRQYAYKSEAECIQYGSDSGCSTKYCPSGPDTCYQVYPDSTIVDQECTCMGDPAYERALHDINGNGHPETVQLCGGYWDWVCIIDGNTGEFIDEFLYVCPSNYLCQAESLTIKDDMNENGTDEIYVRCECSDRPGSGRVYVIIDAATGEIL